MSNAWIYPSFTLAFVPLRGGGPYADRAGNFAVAVALCHAREHGVGQSAGAGWNEAVQTANRAGGIVVGKLGTATVTREELFDAAG